MNDPRGGLKAPDRAVGAIRWQTREDAAGLAHDRGMVSLEPGALACSRPPARPPWRELAADLLAAHARALRDGYGAPGVALPPGSEAHARARAQARGSAVTRRPACAAASVAM